VEEEEGKHRDKEEEEGKHRDTEDTERCAPVKPKKKYWRSTTETAWIFLCVFASLHLCVYFCSSLRISF